jgi:hypothetical protein
MKRIETKELSNSSKYQQWKKPLENPGRISPQRGSKTFPFPQLLFL